MKTEYQSGREAKLRILEMGMRLWSIDANYVTARRIASELNMTHANVLYHFKTSKELIDAIAYYAVKEGESRVIVHLIASKHYAVASLSDAQKQQHFVLASR